MENRPPGTTFTIRPALAYEPFPADKNWLSFMEKIASFYYIDIVHFYQRIRSILQGEAKKEDLFDELSGTNQENSHQNSIALTPEQQTIVDYLAPIIHTPHYAPTLLHGVTGSGKTEIYKKLIIEAICTNKTAIFMVPEVSLALQFERIFRATLPSTIPIYGFHSASAKSDKQTLWTALLANKPVVIIGVHLPIILPISNLGIIIVDEEHEAGFVEKKHPRLHSKEMAIWRAHAYNIPILLGSATPSFSSIFNAKTKSWRTFSLTERFSGTFPVIQTVELLKNKQRPSFWITKQLHEALSNCLERKEQALIFINRRGYSFFVMCTQCSFTFSCDNCSVALTLHHRKNGCEFTEILECHYCNFTQKLPKNCPSCNTTTDKMLKKGVGTEQICAILLKLFPSARIARADLDATKKKLSWKETLSKFESGDLDILVGTQTIAKGYHFPRVTLVGIIWADLNLNFPIFNARERTLQQLIQVAGRAGRQSSESLVILQTMRNDDIFEYVNEQKYPEFYDQEMQFRHDALYPPFCKLLQLELSHTNPALLESETQRVFADLLMIKDQKNYDLTIMGPVRPVVFKIQKTEVRLIYLKAETYHEAHALIVEILRKPLKSRLNIVPIP